jgi:hypothetical protein
MAIKHIISDIGFNDTEIGWLITQGFGGIANEGGGGDPLSQRSSFQAVFQRSTQGQGASDLPLYGGYKPPSHQGQGARDFSVPGGVVPPPSYQGQGDADL